MNTMYITKKIKLDLVLTH